MSEVQTDRPIITPATSDELSFWAKHRLTLLLVITFLIAIVLTSVGMILYNISGAAQLDLSRPGFQSVSNKVETEEKMNTYSATGPVNKDTIKEFTDLYDKQAEKAKAVDAFNGDPLNPEVLIPAPAQSTTTP